jgi:hypothetical protein
MVAIDQAVAMPLRHFLIWRRMQMNQRIARRSRSAMKLSTAAPRRLQKEWLTTFWGMCPQVLEAKGATKPLIAASGAKHHGRDANSGASNKCENSTENWNAAIQDPNGNESPGESIGPPRKHRGGFRALRSVLCAARRAGRIDDPNWKRWRDLRKCQTRADTSRSAEGVEARVSSNRGSLWRFESEYSCQLKKQLRLSRRFQETRTRMAADVRHVAECFQWVHPIAVGSLGPSELTELLPPLRPILRRYRVIVFASSLRDLDARVRSLLATYVSTQEGTERALPSYAYRSSNRAAPPGAWVSGRVPEDNSPDIFCKRTCRKGAGGNEANRFFSDEYSRRGSKVRIEGENLMKLLTVKLGVDKCGR